MAKTKAKGESKSRVFKRLFEENPHLLDVSGYDEILQKYQALNPNVDTQSLQAGQRIKLVP